MDIDIGCADDAFATSRARFEQVCAFLDGEQSGSLDHGALGARAATSANSTVLPTPRGPTSNTGGGVRRSAAVAAPLLVVHPLAQVPGGDGGRQPRSAPPAVAAFLIGLSPIHT